MCFIMYLGTRDHSVVHFLWVLQLLALIIFLLFSIQNIMSKKKFKWSLALLVMYDFIRKHLLAKKIRNLLSTHTGSIEHKMLNASTIRRNKIWRHKKEGRRNLFSSRRMFAQKPEYTRHGYIDMWSISRCTYTYTSMGRCVNLVVDVGEQNKTVYHRLILFITQIKYLRNFEEEIHTFEGASRQLHERFKNPRLLLVYLKKLGCLNRLTCHIKLFK